MVNPAEEKHHFWRFRSLPITLEPAGFLLFFAVTLRQIVYQNVYLLKACRVNFNFNASQCDFQNLENSNETIYEDEAKEVQSFVSSFLIYVALLENLPGVFFILFLGPWSNKHGRKPLMISSIFGFTLMTLITMANLYFDSWPVEYNLFGSLVFGLCGGAASFFMASGSYLTDVSSEETRTYRFSLYNGITFVSAPIASFVGVHLLKHGGEWAVWFTTLALLLLCLGYLAFFVTDSRGKSSPSHSAHSKDVAEARESAEPENWVSVAKNLQLCFVTTFRKRPGLQRACILALIVINCLTIFALALGSVVYLYTRVKFNWNASDYAQYMTVSSLSPGLGALIFVPVLSGHFKLNDGVLGLLALVGMAVTNAMVGFATDPIMMYLSTISSVLESGIDVVVRSSLSKLVDKEDIGHLFSFMACVTSTMPLLISPAVKTIYKATLSVFPGCVFVVGVGVNVLAIVLLSFVAVAQLKRRTEDISHESGTERKESAK